MHLWHACGIAVEVKSGNLNRAVYCVYAYFIDIGIYASY